jgi:threonine dehydratase
MLLDMQLAHNHAARDQIHPHVVRTPLLSAEPLGLGTDVRLKAEVLQRSGSFKIRGALSRALALDPATRARGLVAFSSGNHAQAVALAARMLGTRATIVMPDDAMPHKVEATRGYGAEVVQGVTPATRARKAAEIAETTGATLVPPFDDAYVVAGQGTVGLEIVEDWAEVETIVVPTGGAGLLSGVALAATSLKPDVRVVGVEPEAGNDVQQSTIADGARTIATGEINFAILRERVSEIVTVPDDALIEAMRELALRCKVVVEPTGALAIAALRLGRIAKPGKTAVVLSGGNVAPSALAGAMGA